MTPVRLEPAALRSRVKHSTTEPLPSLKQKLGCKHIYRTYKTTIRTECYVKSNTRRDHRRILAQFRSCNLPLAIETGRFTMQKTPLNERLCPLCEASVIEEEAHLLISCSFYSDLRHELFQNTSDVNTNFESDSEKTNIYFNEN